MIRFAIFVDGSNQFGSFRNMGIKVDDYQAFYTHVFGLAVEIWRASVSADSSPDMQLRRVYWYEIGTMDTWDLSAPKTLGYLQRRFDDDRGLKGRYMAEVGRVNPGADQADIAKEAFEAYLAELRRWYAYKQKILRGMGRFHHGVRSQTDFIDIVEAGHWRVDPVHMSLTEKGIDTSLAVDMVALAENYDVGVIVSGDADHIPSIKYLKTRNKHVAAVEFFSGYPPEKRGRSFSSKLKLNADFVVPVYEMELVKEGIAVKADPSEQIEAESLDDYA